MQITKDIWAYFGQSQSVFTRLLHFSVILLVANQFLTSDLVDLKHASHADQSIAFSFGTWAHILPGMLLAFIAIVFVASELYRHGSKYFFPYLLGDLTQLKKDLQILAARQLPEVVPGGLPAIVQGLGLLVLGLTLLSGLTWFYLIETGSGLAHTVIEVHEVLTNLVIAYLIGHGGMGLLHMVLWIRSSSR